MTGREHHVFVTGGTGYVGRPLVTNLLTRGHVVRGLVRPGSEAKLPSGARAVVGNPLDRATWASAVAPADTLVHLVGTPRPNPYKGREFRAIDLVSIRASVAAAADAGIQHLVYVSIAHPAPIMQAYIEVRQQGEALISAAGLSATVLRPWYVLGPGHWWPYLLVPVYAVLRWWPPTSASVNRLGLVSLQQMVAALTYAVEHPPTGVKVMEVPEIRAVASRDSDTKRT